MKKIHASFFIVILVYLQIIFTDYLIYFLQIRYLYSNIIALAINILIVCLIRKHIKLEINFNKFDALFLGGLFTFFIFSVGYPDTTWDTFSYHVYLQQNPFIDKVNFDLFPGRTLTSFVFPTADRINFLFANILGYRVGTIFQYYIFIVLFYQVKRILTELLSKVDKNIVSILSIIPIFTFVLLEQTGTYYIDNFSVMLVLELVIMSVIDYKNIFSDRKNLYYLSVLTGLLIATKITNLVYIIVPVVFIIMANYKDIKKIKIWDYFICLAIVIIPSLPYIIDNIVQTGSPLYPYYNNIFRSDLFPHESWLDTRYGPKNILEWLIWPVFTFIAPSRVYDSKVVDYYWLFGYIILIVYIAIIIIKKKHKDNTLFRLSVLSLLFYLLWAKFLLGYTRYGGIIPTISIICSLVILINNFQNKRNTIINVCLSITIIISILYSFINYLHCKNTLFNFFFRRNIDYAREYMDNAKFVFKDYGLERIKIDGVWGVVWDDSLLPTLLRHENDRIIHLNRQFAAPTDELEEKYLDIIRNNTIYVPVTEFNKSKEKLDTVGTYDFEIIDEFEYYEENPIFRGTLKILKLEYKEGEI